MTLKLKNFPLSYNYNESVVNFIPKSLKKEKLYESSVRSISKKEVEMEIKNMTLSQVSSYTSLLKSVENRFWTYGKFLLSKSQSYTLCFKSFDTMLFNDRKNKLTNLNSLTYAYSSRKHNLRAKKFPFVAKSRLLALTKSGFKLNFFGLRVLLKPFAPRKKKYKAATKRNKVSYRSWLILNLNLIGLLSSFRISNWNLQFLKLSKKGKFFAKKWDSYYHGNLSLKSNISLKKY